MGYFLVLPDVTSLLLTLTLCLICVNMLNNYMTKLHIDYIPTSKDSDQPPAFPPSAEQISVRLRERQEVGHVAATFVADKPPLPPAMRFSLDKPPLPPESIKKLAPEDRVRFNLDIPLYSSSSEICNRPPEALDAPVLAEIIAAEKQFFLIDTRENHRRNLINRDFALVSPEDMDSIRSYASGFKGLQYNHPLFVGQKHLNDRFTYPDTVSYDHFELFYDEHGVQLINLHPLNPTTVIGHFQPANLVEANYTVSFAQDNAHQHYDTMYNGRKIIDRHTRHFNGAISPSVPYGEAILVDADSAQIRQVYQNIKREITNPTDPSNSYNIRNILRIVSDNTAKAIPYNLAATDELCEPYCDYQVMKLSRFIDNGTGVCRHQALLAASLIEKLQQNRLLQGYVTVNRNDVHYGDGRAGGHMWAVYHYDDNPRHDMIVDPAQDFVGTRNEAKLLPNEYWDYRDPDNR